MNILIDENIPYAEEFFSSLGQIKRFAGRELSSTDLIDADILLVRSITKVNAALLSDATRLKFVGTATIGEDHIDKDLLLERSIQFCSAPGCNAISVAEYVISALCVLGEQYQFDFRQKTVAIVGVGNIGKALQTRLEVLGCQLMLVDPVREQDEYNGDVSPYVDLDTALSQADIVTLHTPLTKTGEFPTFHLLDEAKLGLLKEDVCLINACRGEVIDNQALLEHVKIREASGVNPMKLVLDVWEGEPHPLMELIPFADLASAHIAGYSLEGKARGTEILYQQVCSLLDRPVEHQLTDILPTADIHQLTLNQFNDEFEQFKRLVHLVYDVRRDDALFRNLLEAKGFDWLRKNYPLRREWSSLQVQIEQKSSKFTNLCNLGFAF
jgi:erythronate-4-phosphate dehydrogenase